MRRPRPCAVCAQLRSELEWEREIGDARNDAIAELNAEFVSAQKLIETLKWQLAESEKLRLKMRAARKLERCSNKN